VRSDDYLSDRALTVGTTVDAKKTKFGPAEALALARGMKRVVAAKGARTVVIELADGPTDEALLAVLLGNSGNLRAPTLKCGDVLLVGFSADAYREVLGV